MDLVEVYHLHPEPAQTRLDRPAEMAPSGATVAGIFTGREPRLGSDHQVIVGSSGEPSADVSSDRPLA